VWEFIERCANTDDFGEFRGCFHDDFSGWAHAESVPRGIRNVETIGRYLFDQADVRAIELRPIEVRAYGNFAFAHYVAIAVEGHPDGSVETHEERWTDILIKENDRWYWIGDHGGPLAGNR
jgi:ketosteroid isomerase-like protein